MAVFYVLRIECIEDYCNGSCECHQIYWFNERMERYDVDIATFLGGLDSHAIEIESKDSSEHEWYAVGAKLIRLEGCRESFEQGLKMGREEAFLTCDEDRVSHTLLPTDFVPRVTKTKNEAHRFTLMKEFEAFFKEKTKGDDDNEQEQEAATTRKKPKVEAEQSKQ